MATEPFESFAKNCSDFAVAKFLMDGTANENRALRSEITEVQSGIARV